MIFGQICHQFVFLTKYFILDYSIELRAAPDLIQICLVGRLGGIWWPGQASLRGCLKLWAPDIQPSSEDKEPKISFISWLLSLKTFIEFFTQF